MIPTHKSTRSGDRVITSLEMQRGIAAMLVVVSHSLLTMVEKVGSGKAYVSQAFWIGQIGVANFFVISGFIIYEAHRNDFGDRNAVRGFVLKRIGRIVPMYWLSTLVLCAKYIISGEFFIRGFTAKHVLLTLLFVPFALPGGAHFGFPLNGVGWTLEYEVFFYAIVAIFMSFGMLLATLGIFATFSFLVFLRMYGYTGNDNILWYYCSPIILYFNLGIVISVLRHLYYRYWKLSLPTGFVYCLCAVVVMMFAIGRVGSPYVCSVIVVGACAFARRPSEGAVPKVDAASIWLGGLTYSVYLTHGFFLGPWGRLVSVFSPGMNVALFVIVGVLGSVILGQLSANYIERPMLRFWRKYILSAPISATGSQS